MTWFIGLCYEACCQFNTNKCFTIVPGYKSFFKHTWNILRRSSPGRLGSSISNLLAIRYGVHVNVLHHLEYNCIHLMVQVIALVLPSKQECDKVTHLIIGIKCFM